MISITKINNVEIILNCEHIESIEQNPDTTITLMNSKKYIARETPEEITNRVIEYKRKIMHQF